MAIDRVRWLVAAITLVASVAVHAVVTLLAMRFEPRGFDRADSTVELELAVRAETPQSVRVPDVVAAAAPTPPRARTAHPALSPTTTGGAAAVRASILLTAIPATPATVVSTDRVCTVHCDAGVGFVLDPGAVALSAVASDQRAAVEALASGAAAGDALSAYLGATANAHPWTTQRAPPDLHRTADGGYVYRSRRMNARIGPDGTVAFGDRPGVTIDGPGPEMGLGLGGTFDATESLMEARGQDPLAAERAWFMRGTEELRDHLAALARHADGEHSLRNLDRRLAAIVADRTLSPATQRARVFDAWDDCETDAIGERARDHIAQFARAHFPSGSSLAYTTAELGAFNARRVSRERFAPYG